MVIIEFFLLSAALGLCIYAAMADIREGIIKNKVLAPFAVVAITLDILLYGLCNQDLLPIFLLNCCVLMVLSAVLFYTHIWAGGDCKLACILALLYPARMYFSYNNSYATLAWAVAISFVFGYFYLILDALISLCKRQWCLSRQQITKGLCEFLLSYAKTIVYLAAFHLILEYSAPVFFDLPLAVQIAIDMFLVWLIGTIRVLKKKAVLGVTVLAVAVLSLITHRIPVGTDLTQYLLVFLVVLIQITISGQNYRTIPTNMVCKGMILSTATTALFSYSRVKGLPGLSAEDLRSRLTEDEAESVRRWGTSAYGRPQVVIIRKIPFAVFIALGFIVYFMIWSVL